MAFCGFLYVLYKTPTFGHFNQNKGILSLACMIYCEIPVAITYLFCGCAGSDKEFMLKFLYKVHMLNLCTTIVCYIIDEGLYLFSFTEFCKLQVESSKDDCADRNNWFFTQFLLFMAIFAPLWYGCATASYLYAKNDIHVVGGGVRG